MRQELAIINGTGAGPALEADPIIGTSPKSPSGHTNARAHMRGRVPDWAVAASDPIGGPVLAIAWYLLSRPILTARDLVRPFVRQAIGICLVYRARPFAFVLVGVGRASATLQAAAVKISCACQILAHSMEQQSGQSISIQS